MKNRFIQIAYITKTRMANLNSSEGGGNIVPLKKIQSFDNKTYAYISGQALRRYLREVLLNMGENIAAVDKDGNPLVKEIVENGQIKDEVKMFKKCIDLDVFGYMLPKGGRRWSPIKVSSLISNLPYRGQQDFLTRKKEGQSTKKTGDIANIEIDVFNYMSGNIMVHVDSVGQIIDEYSYSKKDVLGENGRKERVNKFLDAVKYLYGGAKQARLLEDIAPKFVICVRQKTGNPFLLDLIKVNEKGSIKISQLAEALKDYSDVIESYSIGIRQGIFTNEDQIGKTIGEKHLCTVNEAIEAVKL